MMSVFDLYKKRVVKDTLDYREYTAKEIENTFKKILLNDPSSLDLKVTDIEEPFITDDTKVIKAIVNDLSNNDQKSLDEKMLLIEKNENVDVGCYVFFDSCYWIIVFKEHMPINAYKKFIMRRCNQIINLKFEGVIYNIPVSVKNLTQYSDGMQDIKTTSMSDAKRTFTYGSNPITRMIDLNHRILLNKRHAFRVTHLDDFQYNGNYTGSYGLVTALAIQTALIDEDDIKNNVAYNELHRTPKSSQDLINIIGHQNVIVGSKPKYSLSIPQQVGWEIEYIGNKKDYLITNKVNDDCVLKVSSDMKIIGQTFKIKAYDNANLLIDEKVCTITGVV